MSNRQATTTACRPRSWNNIYTVDIRDCVRTARVCGAHRWSNLDTSEIGKNSDAGRISSSKRRAERAREQGSTSSVCGCG